MSLTSPLGATPAAAPLGAHLNVEPSASSGAADHGLGFAGNAGVGGDLAADLTVNLYDKKGNLVAPQLRLGGASLKGDALPSGWSEIDVALSGAQITVRLGPSGQILATETSTAGVTTYDSTAPANPTASAATLAAQQTLANIATQLGGLASASSGTTLTKATSLVAASVGELFDPGQTASEAAIVVSVTTGANVSVYQVAQNDSVIAERTGGAIALEKVARNGATSVDSVRRVDGSGYTTYGILTIAYAADGTETVTVNPSELLDDPSAPQAQSPGQISPAGVNPTPQPDSTNGPAAPVHFTDALGDDVTITASGEILVAGLDGTKVAYDQTNTFTSTWDPHIPQTVDENYSGIGSLAVTAKIGGSSDAERARISSGATLAQTTQDDSTVDVSAVDGNAASVTVSASSNYGVATKENASTLEATFATTLDASVAVTGAVVLNELATGTEDDGQTRELRTRSGYRPIVSSTAAGPDVLSAIENTATTQGYLDKRTQKITPGTDTANVGFRFLGSTVSI
jgi:hypothetical protein